MICFYVCVYIYCGLLQTPVHYAVIHNSPACLETLLEWGGDLYQRDESGKSPLDYFTCSFLSTIIDTLKQYSAGKVIRNIYTII